MKKPVKMCAALRNHAKHDKPIVINDDGRTCNKCGDFHEWDNFYKRHDSYTGHEGTCIPCKKKQMAINDAKRPKKRVKAIKVPEVDSNLANAFLMGRL